MHVGYVITAISCIEPDSGKDNDGYDVRASWSVVKSLSASYFRRELRVNDLHCTT